MLREEAIEFIAQSIKSDIDMALVADAIKALEQEPTYYPPCIDCNKKMDEIRRAYDKLREQEPRWIPVSEKMPEPNRLVLCYITTGATETYFLALWNNILNAWEEGIGGYRLLENDLGYEVIAWMPLPKPYESQKNEDNNAQTM